MQDLKWSVQEYEEKERSPDWFWALGIIVVAGSIASIFFKNYFFAILLLLSGGAMVLFAFRKPEMIEYELNGRGLRVKDQIFLYKDIKSFFATSDPHPTLFVRTQRIFMPVLSIPIDSIPKELLKNKFTEYGVKEEEMKEHIGEKIMDHLGF